MNQGVVSLALILAMILGVVACYADDGSTRPKSKPSAEPTTQAASSMKISLTFPDKTLTATLTDNETTRDFVSLLPLTLIMNDLFGREKYGQLPRAISDGGQRHHTYEVGQLIYWSPGPDLAIYYKDDGEKIPAPGIIVIGKVDSGVAALNVPGSVNLTIELIGKDEMESLPMSTSVWAMCFMKWASRVWLLRT